VGDYVKEPDSTTATTIAEQVYRMSTDKPRLALVNLRSGDLWVSANLSLYMLLLANRSSVEVVVFIHQIDSGPRTYLGSASVTMLANVLSARDRALSNAYHATEAIPLVNPLVVGPSLGEEFFKKLSPQGPTQEQKNDWVNWDRLRTLADPALIFDSVESRGKQTLSKRQQRAILAFPLSYVPIRNRHGHLDEVVDKGQLAEQIALSALGL